MTRTVELSRAEAEMLVDLCEITCDKRLWWLADDIRKKFGMSPADCVNGTPKPPDISYLGIKCP